MVSCYALINAYTNHRLGIMTRKNAKIEKKEKKIKKLDGNLFKSDKVVEFFNEIDRCCREGLESVFATFKIFQTQLHR